VEGTKESDLIAAVLMYAIRCLAEGDQAALRAMNFGPREIEALREMHLADLYRVESLRAHCLDIVLNRDVYWPMIEHLRRQRESEELQQVLIAADAPLEMMQTLFGLGSREYTRLRRMLTVDPSVGRPAEPDEDSTHTLWNAWAQRADREDDGPLPAKEYLAINQETGISMRAIWNLLQRWSQYGDLTGRSSHDPTERACSDG
jgi:hypothetical protein